MPNGRSVSPSTARSRSAATARAQPPKPVDAPPWVRFLSAAPTARGQGTRQQIIDAAESLFRDFANYENITVSDIAKASRTSVGTIYRYFESKEDLLHLVLSNAFWRMFQASRGTWRDEESPAENLKRTTEAYLRAYWEERAFIRLALRLVSTSESVSELWSRMRSEVRERMKVRLEQNQAVAAIAPLTPELMIRMLVGMVDDYAASAFIDEEFGPPSPSDIPAAASVLSEIWHRAVFGLDSSTVTSARRAPRAPR